MAHYAKVENNIVQNVIVADSDHVLTLSGTWLQCSYNTYGGVHKNGGTPLRYNYPAIGFNYNDSDDAFYAPDPNDSNWAYTLNTSTYVWDLDSARYTVE